MEKQFHTNTGDIVLLGSLLGGDAEGLEGAVYRSLNSNELIKIFKNTIDRRLKERKILSMLEHPPLGSAQNMVDGRYIYIAWPTAALYDENGSFVGYTMPEIKTTRSLALLKNPQKRRANFPDADELLPYIAAANLATIIHNLHSSGYIVGDFSPNNFLVDDDGVVYTIDTDSFQMNDSFTNQLLRCEVGTPDYFPREYLVASDHDETPTFTVEGDLFSLGKLIFQLLMNGFDPHTGKSPGKISSVNIDLHCVKRGIYVYNNDVGYTPPRKAPSITDLPAELAKEFNACFIDGSREPSRRPTAKQWETVLDDHYMSVKHVDVIPMASKDTIKDESIKRLPCILCLDTSGSMLENNAIEALNDGVTTLVNTLKMDRKAQMVVDLAIITFGGTSQVLSDFTPVIDFRMPKIEAVNGFTPFYGALSKSFDMMDQRTNFCAENGIALRKPIIIIMTDGKPLDAEKRSIIRSRVDYIRERGLMDIVAVGIGSDYSEDLLDEICTDNWPRRMGMKQDKIVNYRIGAAAEGFLSNLFHRRTQEQIVSERYSTDSYRFRHIRLEKNAQDFIRFFKLISSNVAGGIR